MTTEEKPEEQLQALLEAAKTARLSPADEETAGQLLKQTLGGGPKAAGPSLDALILLPWSVGVKAVTETWPELKPTARTRLITGLTKMDSDGSKRMRLSLARGLYAQDPASAIKMLMSVAESMSTAEGGAPSKDRQTFANVLIGKAKPWLMNIALGEMKPAEALKLMQVALETCQYAPIFTQIWMLRWIAEADKFDAFPPEQVENIAKTIQRWQPRWRKELRKTVTKLPPPIEAVLAADAALPERPERQERTSPPPAEGRGEQEPREQGPPREQEPRSELPPAEAPLQRVARGPEPSPRERDRRPQQGANAPQGHFDLTRTLRDIEGYVVRLRSDLAQAQTSARRREPAPARGRNAPLPPVSNAELDELRRHNDQLESQNQELRQRLEELTSDHEDRAATLDTNDALEQFKILLGLKLKEDLADYNAISRESLNEVVRRHSQELLAHIFSVLKAEGVRFDAASE